MVSDEGADLIANGGKRSVLYLDKPLAHHDVDPIASQGHLELGLFVGIEALQFTMERSFHSDSSAGTINHTCAQETLSTALQASVQEYSG